MEMLTKDALGRAITEAMTLKGVGPTAVAKHFGLRPPSISTAWRKKGQVDKKHIGKLIEYFADVVPPEHWGMRREEVAAAYAYLGSSPPSQAAPLVRVKAGVPIEDMVSELVAKTSQIDKSAFSIEAIRVAKALDTIKDPSDKLAAYTMCITAISRVREEPGKW
jgi:hypothetical protein